MLIISARSVKPAATARKVNSPSMGLRIRADQMSGQYFKAFVHDQRCVILATARTLRCRGTVKLL
jgi:hypothetical protein